MKKYVVLQKQRADGCDYSIACGKDYNFIESDLDIETLINRVVLKYIFSYDEYRDSVIFNKKELSVNDECLHLDQDFLLETLILIDITDGGKYIINVDEVINLFNKNKQKKKEEKETLEELKELERLQKKYQQ